MSLSSTRGLIQIQELTLLEIKSCNAWQFFKALLQLIQCTLVLHDSCLVPVASPWRWSPVACAFHCVAEVMYGHNASWMNLQNILRARIRSGPPTPPFLGLRRTWRPQMPWMPRKSSTGTPASQCPRLGICMARRTTHFAGCRNEPDPLHLSW